MYFTCKKNDAIGECYYYSKHESGLDVYVIPKKMSTTYALFATKFGSIDNKFMCGSSLIELPDGIAHFLEHKMFENEDGTDTFARYAKTGANANAYTTFDRTCYLFSATEKVEQSLEILLDFVTHPYFTDATVQKEQGIIGQEIRMYDDNPAWQLYFGMLTAMYHNNTVRIDTAGTVETISHITPKLLFDAYGAFYNLGNMALCVCGDITPEAVNEVCDKVLVNVPAKPVKRIYPEEPKGRFKEFVSKKLEVSMPMFAVGIKDNDCPASGEKLARKQACYDILLDMIFGKSARFYTQMYESGLIDSSFSYDYECSETFAHCEISGCAENPEEVYGRIREEIRYFKKNGLNREDFERIKRANYAQSLRVFNSTDDTANEFLVYKFAGFDLLDYPQVISDTHFEDVCALLENNFDENDFVLSTVLPLSRENKQ